MYFDSEPCHVCGSKVTLRAGQPEESSETDGPVGPRAGYVGAGDETVDDRICTNPDCPTNAG